MAIQYIIAEKRRQIEKIEAEISVLESASHILDAYEPPLQLLRPEENYGALRERVFMAIRELELHNFTIKNIYDWFRMRMPDYCTEERMASVSATLSTLSKEGFLAIVEPGKGRTPTVYRMTDRLRFGG